MPFINQTGLPTSAVSGRHVFVVCTGEACLRRGAGKLLGELRRMKDNCTLDLRIGACRCLGHCALGPAIMEDGRLVGAVTPGRLRVEVSRITPAA